MLFTVRQIWGRFLSYSYTFGSSPPLSLSHHHFSISDLFYLILIHLNHHHPREFISLIIIILALLRSFWRSERFKLVLVGFSKVWSFLEQLKLSDPSPCKLLWDVCMQDWIVASMFWMVDSWFSQNNLKKIGFNISADISYISVFCLSTLDHGPFGWWAFRWWPLESNAMIEPSTLDFWHWTLEEA